MENAENLEADGPSCAVDQSCCGEQEPFTMPELCTLDPSEMPGLVARWRTLFGLTTGYEKLNTTAQFIFPRQGRIRSELDDLVKLERVCCAHVSWEIDEKPNSIVLTLKADADALEDLVKGFIPVDSNMSS